MDIFNKLNQRPFLKWEIIFTVSLILFGFSYYFGVIGDIFERDLTKLSFVIMGLYFLTSIRIGQKTYQYGSSILNNTEWFIAEALIAIGMIGTVIGFLIFLGSVFSELDINDKSTLQTALNIMAVGMSTSLYTTLTGLIASIFLKSQLVNLETNEF